MRKLAAEVTTENMKPEILASVITSEITPQITTKISPNILPNKISVRNQKNNHLDKNCFTEYIKTLMKNTISQNKRPFDKNTGPFYINNEDRYDHSSTITCNDDTCTEGSWYDCDCEYTSVMSMQYDTEPSNIFYSE